MYPEGIIYDKSQREVHGERILEPPLLIRAAYYLFRYLGAGLIGFVVIGFLFSYGPVLKEEVVYNLEKQNYQDKINPAVFVDVVEADKVIEVQRESQAYGVNSYFSIVIPKINAASNIVANVDPSEESQYLEALKKGVAHAKGTNFPGQEGTIFLFSHSTDLPINIARYNAVFYLLRKLEVGDKIIVFFADQKYEYEVENKLVISPKDTSWLTENTKGERLVLQTCDPPGTAWRRLLVIAKPAG